MKTGDSSTSLNLPTLLSFNELAWIAVSAMALFCGYLLSQSADDPTDGLQQQLAALKASRQAWSNRLAQAAAELRDAAERLADAEGKTAELKTKLAQTEMAVKALTNRLSLLQEESPMLKAMLDEAGRRLAEATNRLAAALAQLAERPTEGNVRKELLSLRGALSNVVILLDRSASMKDSRRWEDALRVIESWLQYLPIENCALITFSSDCEAFPAAGQFLAVGGTNDPALAARSHLLRQVRSLQPDGNTATVEALQLAYGYPGVDTIILFTDGEPLDLRRAAGRKQPLLRRESELTAGERRRIAKAQIEEALALSRKHPHIPINVVALGDYFADWKAEFLLGLARNSGGAFLGR